MIFDTSDIVFREKESIQKSVSKLAAAIGPSFHFLPKDGALLNPPSFVLNNPYQTYQHIISLAQASGPIFEAARGEDVDLVGQFIGFVADEAIRTKQTHCRTYYDVVMTAKGFFFLRSWEVSWLLLGFPRVSLASHKYAASLMSTVITPKFVPEIIPPWDAFTIDIPSGLIETSKGSLHRVRVFYESMLEEKLWNIFAEVDHRTVLRLSLTPEKLTEISEMETERAMPAVKGILLTDEYERMMALVGRLVLNVCLAMTDKERVPHRAVPTAAPVKGGFTSVKAKYPPTLMYTLGADVKVDCREPLRSYMHGNGSPLTVRRLIAGHWKMQPHGPKNALRKYIHVLPYWQGEEGAPIVMRTHRLEES